MRLWKKSYCLPSNSHRYKPLLWTLNIQMECKKKGGGSISHFRQVYDELYPKLMVHACKFVDEEVAEDIVHDVFVAYWEQHHMIVSSRLAAFLFKATQNSCLNYLKHQKVVENYREQWQLAIDRCEYYNQKIESTVSMSETNEELNYKLLENAIRQLPPRRAEALNLFYFEGKSQKDIANQMHVSLRTVQTHLAQAIAELRKSLRHVGIWIALMLNYILL